MYNILILHTNVHNRCTVVLEGHDGAVRDCVWAPDGNTVLTAGDDCIKIWDRCVSVCLRIYLCKNVISCEHALVYVYVHVRVIYVYIHIHACIHACMHRKCIYSFNQ